MTRRLRNWLESFKEYASTSEAPFTCLYWTGVVSIAGAMRRNVWIPMGHFTYCCNHFVIIVAPPGVVSKTTTADLGMKLLREVGADKPGGPIIKFGPDIVTWEALVQRFAEANQADEHKPGEYLNHCSLTMASGEMGNLIDPQNRAMLDTYVNLWDARQVPFEKHTKGSGTDNLVNPWVNMIACTTPAWIAGAFPEYSIGGGFMSRCIFVFEDQKRQRIAYPQRRIIPATHAKLRADLIHDLERISELRGEFRLSEEAYEFGEHWYNEVLPKAFSELDPVLFGGYASRKQGHVHKLAMVQSASQDDTMLISLDVLKRSMALVDETEKNLHRVFELVGRSSDAKIANVIIELVNRMGERASRGSIHGALLHRYGSDEVSRGLATCLSAGELVESVGGDGVTLVAKRLWQELFPKGSVP